MPIIWAIIPAVNRIIVLLKIPLVAKALRNNLTLSLIINLGLEALAVTPDPAWCGSSNSNEMTTMMPKTALLEQEAATFHLPSQQVPGSNQWISVHQHSTSNLELMKMVKNMMLMKGNALCNHKGTKKRGWEHYIWDKKKRKGTSKKRKSTLKTSLSNGNLTGRSKPSKERSRIKRTRCSTMKRRRDLRILLTLGNVSSRMLKSMQPSMLVELMLPEWDKQW